MYIDIYIDIYIDYDWRLYFMVLKTAQAEIILSFVKGSWDNLPDDTKQTFYTVVKIGEKLPISKIAIETKIDRTKINSCIAALEALQLIVHSKFGQGKYYELTDLGASFAETKLNVNVED